MKKVSFNSPSASQQQIDVEAAKPSPPQDESGLPEMPEGPFVPNFEATDASFVRSETMQSSKKYQAPEQKLTLLAVRLVALEKMATGLGKLAFIWATVVLIGGLGGDLTEIDFWVMTGLLLTEGTRVFSRSQEVLLKHAASRLSSLWEVIFAKSGRYSSTRYSSNAYAPNQYQPEGLNPAVSPKQLRYRKKRDYSDDETHDSNKQDEHDKEDEELCHSRKWSPDSVQVVPFAKVFSLQNTSIILHVLEVSSALVSMGLSVFRLYKHNFNGEPKRRNLANASFLFYALILTEASIFVMERAYWSYRIYWQDLLGEVTKKSNLTENHLTMVKEFFYQVYNDCLNGHTFEGLDMDLVEFAIKKIQSDDATEQQGGVTMLSIFVTRKDDQFATESLRKIGSTPGAIERLLEMITWKDKKEREVRRAAAWIVKNLVNQVSNYYFRIAATVGAVEGVISLLSDVGADKKDSESLNVANELKSLGLETLVELSKDPKNCFKIGTSRGLNAILVSFIEEEDIGRADDQYEFEIIQKSLELLKNIASTPGEAGISLRKDIAKTVFVLRNLRDILEHGNRHPKLQGHGISLLTSLALDEQIREHIGNTGAIILHLRALFTRQVQDPKSDEFMVGIKAGEALDLLALHSPRNCKKILGHRSYDDKCNDESLLEIIGQLNRNPKLAICAGKVLRSLWESATEGEKKMISKALPVALATAMERRKKEREAALGLVARVLGFISNAEFESIIIEKGWSKDQLVDFAIELVFLEAPPSGHLPKLRRHAVEFVSELAQKHSWFATSLKEKGVIQGLEKMLNSVSDVENYHAFSGSMGLIPHSQPLGDVIDAALCLLSRSS